MTVKTDNYQIGVSATAAQNFSLTTPAVPDGTMKLARGLPGATTQDILSIDAAGDVTAGGVIKQTPAKLNMFSVYITANTAFASIGTAQKVALNVEDTDTANVFSTVNNRFQPTKAGWYQINAAVCIGSGAAFSTGAGYLYKTGAAHKQLSTRAASASDTTTAICTGSTLVHLNGTTEYIELWAIVASGGAGAGIIGDAGGTLTYMNGYLVAAD
jgi:hypothetical protein